MTFKASLRRSLRWMPGPLKAKLEYHFDPTAGNEFGGPFNGQEGRQEIFRDLVQAFQFQAAVETGTFRGTTTSFIAETIDAPIYTVELDPRMYHFAKLRLRDRSSVTVKCGDSRSFLKELIGDASVPKSNVLFYLDAHWNEDLPLYDEVAIIAENWTDSVVMIDDFEVPADPGYAFDDYGEGRKLCLEYLGEDVRSNWSVFFPSRNSSEETGFRRGCVVLGSRSLEHELG